MSRRVATGVRVAGRRRPHPPTIIGREDPPNGAPRLLGKGLPDVPLHRETTALLIIDMQYFDADRASGIGAIAAKRGLADTVDPYFTRIERTVVPNLAAVLAAARAADILVAHCRIAGARPDGRDMSPRYRHFGFVVPQGTRDAEFLDPFVPAPNEIVVDKTTSSCLACTNLDSTLRTLEITSLLIAGVVTNNCVESTARHASDLGYEVVIVDDCCAAWSAEEHERSLSGLHRNFAVVATTDSVLRALKEARVV